MSEFERRYVQSERVAARIAEGRAVLVAIDQSKVVSLNAVGTAIWELADGRTTREIANGLRERFADVDPTVDDDVAEFVGCLSELGLLKAAS